MRQVGPRLPLLDPGKAPAVALAGVGALVLLAAAFDASGAAWRQALLLVAVAPLLEEIVFRAGVQTWLRRATCRPLVAVALTAALFGLAHVAVRGEPAAALVVVPALAIGWVFERTGRLRGCVALHAAMNALWLAGSGLA